MSSESTVELSVVIVTYCNEKQITACLLALAGEIAEYQHEIFLVDNHSQDHTRKSIQEIWLQIQNPNFSGSIQLNEKNLGFTRALNQGLKKCSGRFILVLNPDTEVQPSCLHTLKSALEREPNVGVVAPQLVNPDGTVQPSCRRFPGYRDVLFEIAGLSYLFQQNDVFNRWKMADFDHRQTKSVDQPQGACLMFRREVLESTGLWDEQFPIFFSDVDWCLRVKSQGIDILFEPAAKVIHHQGVSVQQHRLKMIWSSHRSFYDYFKKHKKGKMAGVWKALFGGLFFLTAIFRMAAVWLNGLFISNKA